VNLPPPTGARSRWSFVGDARAAVDHDEVGDLERLHIERAEEAAPLVRGEASLVAVSAMLPPSERNIPYFCRARATTRAAGRRQIGDGVVARRRRRAP